MITLKANAKINLTLDILGKRLDGYHEIETVMQSVSLSDTVTLEKSERISLSCSAPQLSGRENLAFRAAELFFETAGLNCGAEIKIEKCIPLAAGLAGGSADAAAVLVGLNVLFNTNFCREQICEMGRKLGADVPFCTVGGTMIARGIGEKLSAVPPMPDCGIVIAKTGKKPSTGELYAQFDGISPKKHPDSGKMLSALKSKSLKDVSSNLCNVFEEVSAQCLGLKEKMIENGAIGAALSGSGPSVFGIFESESGALNCAENLNAKTFVCKPVQKGCEIIYY